jgi:hypothetical protein
MKRESYVMNEGGEASFVCQLHHAKCVLDPCTPYFNSAFLNAFLKKCENTVYPNVRFRYAFQALVIISCQFQSNQGRGVQSNLWGVSVSMVKENLAGRLVGWQKNGARYVWTLRFAQTIPLSIRSPSQVL